MPAGLHSRITRWGSVRDQSLENAFAGHDALAYEAAYRSFGPRMHATALRLLRDTEAAHECVQDVFLDLWRRGGGYATARGSLEAFLVTCARNRALMMLRSSTRQRKAVERLDAPSENAFDEDPVERERIGRAVAQLSDGQADVVRLAYFGGLTLTEVAERLSVPIGTVKGRLSSALRSLRRALIPETSDGG